MKKTCVHKGIGSNKTKDECVPKKSEAIEHPKRYVKNGIEVWEIEKAFAAPEDKHIPHFVEHLRFGAVEYILRTWDKNGIADIKKARFLLDRIIKEMEEEGSEKE